MVQNCPIVLHEHHMGWLQCTVKGSCNSFHGANRVRFYLPHGSLCCSHGMCLTKARRDHGKSMAWSKTFPWCCMNTTWDGHNAHSKGVAGHSMVLTNSYCINPMDPLGIDMGHG